MTLRGLSAAIGAALILACARPACAQRALELSTAECAAPWASYERLAPALRAELRSQGAELDVSAADGLAHEPRARLTVRCDADGRAVIEGARPDGAAVRREVSLADVDPLARSRALALLLSDAWMALAGTPSPPAASDAPPEPVEAVEPPSRAGRALGAARPARAERARALDAPAAPAAASPGWSVHPSLAVGAELALRPRTLFPGASLGAALEIPAPWLLLRAALRAGVLLTQIDDELGQVRVVVPHLELELEGAYRFDAGSIGGWIAARPGWAFADSATERADVRATRGNAAILEALAGARLRLALDAAVAFVLDVGLAIPIFGLEARAEERPAVRRTDPMGLARVGVEL